MIKFNLDKSHKINALVAEKYLGCKLRYNLIHKNYECSCIKRENSIFSVHGSQSWKKLDFVKQWASTINNYIDDDDFISKEIIKNKLNVRSINDKWVVIKNGKTIESNSRGLSVCLMLLYMKDVKEKEIISFFHKKDSLEIIKDKLNMK